MRTRGPDQVRPQEGRRLGAAVLALGPLVLVLGPVALLVRGRWEPLVALDEGTSRAAERLGAAVPAVPEAARSLTHLGDPLALTVLAVVGALVCLRAGRRREAVLLLVSRFGALVLSQGTKNVVDRVRPAFEEPVATALGYSFPSGHALGSAAFYASAAVVLLPLVRRRGALLAAAVALPVLVAATRVLIGVHYLSDVLAGLVLGACWTLLCALLLRLRGEDRR